MIMMIRRKFIKYASTAGAAFAIVPNFAVSGLGHTPPSDRLNIAGIGIGGKGKTMHMLTMFLIPTRRQRSIRITVYCWKSKRRLMQ
jgi:hypothetical protein